MAVKKATSATKQGMPAKKAVPGRTAASSRSTGASKATGARAPAATSAEPAAENTAAKKTVPPKPGAKKPAAKKPAARTLARKAAVPRTAAKEAAPPKTAEQASARPQRLRVRENEKPWSATELATVRADLEADIARLQKEISVAELDLVDLMRDAGEGAGDDQADAGTATFEREQEISLANNAREVFEQSTRALARLVDGSYGICESCGNSIGKNRLLAFPRATLCLTCKSKQERR